MKRLSVILLFFILNQSLFAQNEANIWYFGRFAGVDFNSGTPTALNNGILNTGEGCASICDKNGNLLFYTDGITVWNRNHAQMPNGFGMTGHPSSAQSALIVPAPGSTTHYYIFTVAAEGQPAGFGFSEVNMTLDNGLGDVITATKNTQLFTPSAEKVTALKHANGLYVWVIGHGMYNNRYYAYLIDCGGVNAPVISDVGQVEGWPGWGCLTAAPNGLKLATAMRAQGFEVLDFNNNTGVVSNPILLSNPGGAYGVSFSPDNNLLYALSIENGNMYQWNLQAGTPANIINSIENLGLGPGTGVNYRGGTIQIGPDGRIYIPHFNQPFLATINNPNVVGLGCNVQFNSVDLLGRNAVLGLPPFIQSFFDTIETVSFSNACIGSTTAFTITSNTNFLDSVRWFFDDPASGVQNNTSTLLSPSHTFSDAGIYNVQLIRYIDCITDTTIQAVEVTAPPVFTQNISICPDENYTLPGGNIVVGEGMYSDTISDATGCDSIVVTNLSFFPTDSTVLNITICEGQSHTVGGSAQFVSGTYYDLFDNQFGCDSVVATVLTIIPRVFTNNDVAVCPGENYTLPNGTVVSSPGIYNDTLAAANTCDSVVITNLSFLRTDTVTNNVSICEGENYLAGGQAQTVSGTYLDTFQNNVGCDSVVSTILNVIGPVYHNEDVSICEGESYFIGGAFQTDAGIYYDTLLSALNCDSIVITELIINPITSTEVFDTICGYEQYVLPSGNIVNETGTYQDTLVNSFSCDSIVTTFLHVIIPDSTFTEITVCYGDSHFVAGNYQTVSGIYIEQISASGRCDSFAVTHLTVLNPISFEREAYVCYEDSFFTGGAAQFNPGIYYDTLVSLSGCDSLLITNLITSYDDSCGCESFFIPNAFSPNSDGINDSLEVFGGCFKNFHFMIFNRWGEKVFETEKPKEKWGGHFNGKPQQEGVYVYHLFVTTFNNIQHKRNGSITLIR